MKKKILIFILLTISATAATILLVIGTLTNDYVESLFRRSMEEKILRIEKQFSHYQEFLYAIEKKMDVNGDRALRLLARRFRNAETIKNISPEKLKKTARQLGVTEVYFIGSNGTVLNSSLKPDVGLNLQSVSRAMRKYINSIYGSGRIHSQGIFVSISEGNIHHYMYYSPRGSSLIYEISMDVSSFTRKEFDFDLYRFLFEDMFKNFYNEHLYSIDLYSFAGGRGWSLINSKKRLNMEPGSFKELIAKNSLVVEKGSRIYVYRRLDFGRYCVNSARRAYVELIYDVSEVRGYYRKITGYSIGLGVLIVLFVFAAVSKITNRFFLKRVENIISGIEKIRDGDYSVPIKDEIDDEMGEIASAINGMSATIDERKAALCRSNEKLLELSSYINDIIESMPSALITVSGDDRVVWWNRQAEALFSVEKEKARGSNIWQILPGFGVLRDLRAGVLEKNKPMELHRTSVPGREGMLFDIFVYPFTRESSSEVIIMIDDVTEAEKKERQLERARKLEILGTMAGGLAHDFNNIITGIISTSSYLEFLFKDGGEPSAEEVTDSLGMISASGERAAKLARNLMSLPGHKKVKPEKTDLAGLIASVLAMTENTYLQGVRVNFRKPAGEAFIMADRSGLEQVFLNLIVNASEAMKGEGMISEKTPELSIAVENCHTSEPGGLQSDMWHVKVQDNGPGIAPDILDRLFDPLVTTKDIGNGLGLAVVNNIVSSFGGFIEVCPGEGQGACFDVFFPVLEA